MSVTGIILADEARGLETVIHPREGIAWQGHDFTVSAREVAEDRAWADGTDDTTAWLGAGAFTMTLRYYTGSRALIDEVAAFCVPWSRPYLVVSDSEWVSDRQVMLRYETSAKPIEIRQGLVRTAQYSWKAPNGVWEDTARQMWVIAADVPDTTGWSFDATNGLSVDSANGYAFAPSTSLGDSIIDVHGNTRPAWRAKLYGPATGPKLTRDDTGQSVAFTDQLVLASGEYVEIDSRAMSARWMSNADASRLSMLDFPNSQWFPLDPGDSNRLRYHASAGTGPGSVCELTVTPVWMP
jgi:hypothetical protein